MLGSKGDVYCEVGEWGEVSDSFLVWDTVCGEGMSQEFTGAELLQREHKPASSQRAQRGTGEPWALRKGFPAELAAPRTSQSSSLPASLRSWIFPNLFYLQRLFPFLCI